jgi:hypothetical protein
MPRHGSALTAYSDYFALGYLDSQWSRLTLFRRGRRFAPSFAMKKVAEIFAGSHHLWRPTIKTVISNDPAPIGERCFLCEETLTPPWFKTGKFRMHTACRDLVREDFEATHRRRLINPTTANDNAPPIGWE